MNMGMIKNNICPVCSSAEVWQFMEILQIPVYCNVLLSTKAEAMNVEKGDFRLGFCCDCGHIFNLSFNHELLEYSQGYENSLHYSPRFQLYAEQLASDLITRHGLRNRTVVEIGCGKGDFLRLLCRLGGNRGVGFDPSYEAQLDDEPYDENIRFVQDYFGVDQPTYAADLICCRHALEHIPLPTEFLRGLRETIGDAEGTAVYFEVPNGLYTFRDMGIWDLIYEHCSYFWTGSLSRAFELAGFKVDVTQETYESQFIGLEASISPEVQLENKRLDRRLGEIKQYVVDFKHLYNQKISLWATWLDEMQTTGTRVAVWGGGSKCGSFLNVLQVAKTCPVVVDINPKKHGKFIPGTGQQVIPPEGLVEYQPEVVILMNPIYEEEVTRLMRSLGIEAKILLA